ncbi:hypothetical protein RCL_jg9427.t1 [Rhizophagus clarus]|uniref:Crinkler effector protein N-terminal domain-containing protein n=1 Tax=Rhizophagus clarus TaxID=94130 RepID=A0A8H3R409_9GLOM|nr:hypothetical protein RCL_jg9427.t1 [Rhizophagus clarus]
MSVVILVSLSHFFACPKSKTSFKVTLGRDNDVFDFKKIIKNEKLNDFAKIDIDNIRLWKLNEPVYSTNIEKLRKITLQITRM